MASERQISQENKQLISLILEYIQKKIVVFSAKDSETLNYKNEEKKTKKSQILFSKSNYILN